MTIQDKILEYWIKKLHRNSWLAIKTIQRILKNQPIKKEKLDVVYRFFRCEPDLYYFQTLKLSSSKIPYKNIWKVIRSMRIYHGMDIEELAFRSKLSSRQIIRIELGKVIPWKTTVLLILDALWIEEDEKDKILKIRDSEKVIVDLLSKYEI